MLGRSCETEADGRSREAECRSGDASVDAAVTLLCTTARFFGDETCRTTRAGRFAFGSPEVETEVSSLFLRPAAAAPFLPCMVITFTGEKTVREVCTVLWPPVTSAAVLSWPSSTASVVGSCMLSTWTAAAASAASCADVFVDGGGDGAGGAAGGASVDGVSSVPSADSAFVAAGTASLWATGTTPPSVMDSDGDAATPATAAEAAEVLLSCTSASVSICFSRFVEVAVPATTRNAPAARECRARYVCVSGEADAAVLG